MSRSKNLDDFTRAAFEALFWSEGCDDVQLDDVPEGFFAAFVADCKAFQETHGHLFAERVVDSARGSETVAAGHLFTLTRNRHGAGFWDGDYTVEAGRALTEAAHAFGTVGILQDEESGELCFY